MTKLFILLFFTISLSLFAEEDWSLWKYQKDLNIEDKSSTYVVFELDEDIYKSTTQLLSDIRILDSENNQIPYYINSEDRSATNIERNYETALIARNNYEIVKETSFEYQVLAESNDIHINSFQISLDSDSYSQQYELYGRYDDSLWQLIKRDSIYQLGDIVKEKLFPKSSLEYNFYKIVLLDNSEGYSVSGFIPSFSEKLLSSYSYSKDYEMDFDIVNLEETTAITIQNPNRLKLQSLMVKTDSNFNRRYILVDISNRRIIDGHLYNFQNDEMVISNFEILFDWDRSPEFKLTIQNDDNFPLEIEAIVGTSFVNKIVFEAVGKAPYTIIYGNENSEKPIYDIESFKDYINNSDMVIALLNQEIQNPSFVQIEEDDVEESFNYKPILNISIIFVAALLIFLITVKLFKKE